MIMIEDFTKLSTGIWLPIDGRISHCPRCGRKGVRRKGFDGRVRYVHVQASELFGDGLRTEPADCCAISEHTDPARRARAQSPLSR